MMRSQKIGNLYLAGLVTGAALLHGAALIVSTALSWNQRNRSLLMVDLLVVGLVPAIIAVYLTIRGWNEGGGRSATWPSCGLAALLVAIASSHGRGGAL